MTPTFNLDQNTVTRSPIALPPMNNAKPVIDEAVVQITTLGATLEGNLVIPPQADRIAIFVQADGSCRHNPRNHYLAHFLRQYGLATLIVDLLTLEEQMVCSRAAALHYDLDTLAMRLVAVTDWLQTQPYTDHLKMSYLGLQRGAAVAFLAAIARPQTVEAIVMPAANLEREHLTLPRVLPYLITPTLLIVSDADPQVLEQQQQIVGTLPTGSDLAIVRRSGNLLREASSLELIGQLSSQWLKNLGFQKLPSSPAIVD